MPQYIVHELCTRGQHNATYIDTTGAHKQNELLIQAYIHTYIGTVNYSYHVTLVNHLKVATITRLQRSKPETKFETLIVLSLNNTILCHTVEIVAL